jgi:hypothetical protein
MEQNTKARVRKLLLSYTKSKGIKSNPLKTFKLQFVRWTFPYFRP